MRTYERHNDRKFGGLLLRELMRAAKKPILIGTWKAAHWAIRFYEKHGLRLVGEEEKNSLLRRYWAIPDRQIQTSVVMADARYTTLQMTDGDVRRHAVDCLPLAQVSEKARKLGPPDPSMRITLIPAGKVVPSARRAGRRSWPGAPSWARGRWEALLVWRRKRPPVHV